MQKFNIAGTEVTLWPASLLEAITSRRCGSSEEEMTQLGHV